MNYHKTMKKALKASFCILLPLANSCSRVHFDEAASMTEIRLSGKVEVLSKAAYPQCDRQLVSGETVHVWIDRNNSTNQSIYNNIMTVDDSGNLIGEHKMYYPMNGDNVNIYALHTNAVLPDAAFPTATFTHQVQSVQKTLQEYVSSDLLYARAIDIAKTENAVPIKFYHQLSKLQVAIVTKDGIQAQDISNVKITGMKCLANITLDKNSLANAVSVDAAGQSGEISIGSDISEDFSDEHIKYNDVIIVPQSLQEGAQFLSVRLKDGTNIKYTINHDTTFESGKKYTIQMELSLTGIKFNTMISDWLDGDIIDGSNDIVRYIVNYTDSTKERTFTENDNTIRFNGKGKTVRSIDLPDFNKSYLIGRSDIESITLNLNKTGELGFRPSTDGYTPIGSFAEMQLINTSKASLSGKYKQDDNIDLLNEAWTPIGSEDTPFYGTFDGNGFSISNVNISSNLEYVGLFGYIKGSQAALRDITLNSGIIEGKHYVGGICGYVNSGFLDLCTNGATVTLVPEQDSYGGFLYAGGIASYGYACVITNCGNNGTISASCSSFRNGIATHAGGIIGYAENNTAISGCKNSGGVSTGSDCRFSESWNNSLYISNAYSGGIAGNSNDGSISSCYNTGAITSHATSYYSSEYFAGSYSGGITGSGDLTMLSACYNAARVNSSASTMSCSGGIGGNINLITSCYWKTGIGLPGKGCDSGNTDELQSFTDFFTPDANRCKQWGLGNGEENGLWKNYNGNKNLPQLWWE